MVKLLKNEDWLAFAAGLTIILSAIAGLQIPSPKFGWSDIGGLEALLTNGHNILSIIALATILLAVGLLTFFLQKKKITGLIGSVLLLFFISLISQWLAGLLMPFLLPRSLILYLP